MTKKEKERFDQMELALLIIKNMAEHYDGTWRGLLQQYHRQVLGAIVDKCKQALREVKK